MKTYNFIYSEKSRKISKTYGGSTYTMNVYEVVKDDLVLLGEVTACTRGHIGEDSEVWRLIREKRPNVVKTLVKRIEKTLGKDDYYAKAAKGNYYTWRFKEFGVNLRKA